LEWTLYTEAGKVREETEEITRERLSQAFREEDLDAVKALLKAHPALVNTADRSWVTPLHEAAGSASPEIVQALIDAGADVNAGGEAPWRARWRTRHPELNGAGEEVFPVGEPTEWPLKSAVMSGRYAIVELLCDRGANVNVMVSDESTLLT
jgi:cytohesin